jgi:transposase-like protein
MVVSIAGRQMYMWRAVDGEGEVLEILVQPQRDKVAALRLLRKLLRHQGFVPTVIVTDKLRSYGAALREIARGPGAGVVEIRLAYSPGCSTQLIPALERRKGDHAMTKNIMKTAAVMTAPRGWMRRWQCCGVAIQRCTVHKHRNLLAHAPERLHEEISNDYKDMIYADTKQEIATKRPAFIRKWRLKCKAVADSLDEAGDKLFTFTHFPKSQWKSIRTSNAIERLHEEFKRRIKTQTVLPSAETAAMLFWALLASGQITMRKVDGWQSLAEKPSDQIIDLAA